jgi:hypothetical protein
MNWFCHIAGVVVLALAGSLGIAAPQEAELSKEQQEKLTQFQATLEAVPQQPESADEHLANARKGLNTLLSLTNRPAENPTNALATTFVRGINRGAISVPQTVGVSKELAKVLSLPRITSQDTNKFVAAIDPLIQGTQLDNADKMRLYREALRVVQTAPTYSYNQK